MKKFRVTALLIGLCLIMNTAVLPVCTLAEGDSALIEETVAESIEQEGETDTAFAPSSEDSKTETDIYSSEEAIDITDSDVNESVDEQPTAENNEIPESSDEKDNDQDDDIVEAEATEFAYIASEEAALYSGSDAQGEPVVLSGNRIVIVTDETDLMAEIETIENDAVVSGWVFKASLRTLYEDETAAAQQLKDEITKLSLIAKADPDISITIASNVMGVGETLLLTAARIGIDEETPFKISYNKKYLSISGVSGNANTVKIKALKTIASTNITVTCGTVSKTIAMQIVKEPKSIKFASSKTELIVGESSQTNVTYSKGSYATIKYSSSDENVATVDENGVITAVGRGTAVITAKTYKSKVFGKVSITVYREPSEITFHQDEYLIAKGKNFTAVLDAADSLGDPSIVSNATFSTSDSSVISVDTATGCVTAVDYGTAQLEATCNGLTAVATVHVVNMYANVGSIKIGKGNIVDLISDTYFTPEGFTDLHQVSYTFKTSNVSKVKVFTNGYIKGIAKGSAIITVNTDMGLEFKFRVTVADYPGTMTLNSGSAAVTKLSMGVGMTKALEVKLDKNTYTLLSFSSTDESVVAVSASDTSAKLTAVGVGEADIIVTANSGKFAASPKKCHVIVQKAPETISFTKSSYHIGAGDTIAASVILDDDSYTDVKYSLSSTEGISVSSKGVIKTTEAAAGKTYILTAKTHVDGVSAETEITVGGKPTSIVSADATEITIQRGAVVALPSVIVYSGSTVLEDAYITYTSSNSKILTVDETGSVKGIKNGSTRVTVRTSNKKALVIKVNVVSGNVSSVALDRSEMKFYIRSSEGLYGDGIQLSGKVTIGGKSCKAPLSWSSSDPEIASVDTNGFVEPTGVGTCTITAAYDENHSASCKVTVVNASSTLSFENSTTTGVGKSEQLIPVFENSESSSDLHYTSSDSSIISVTDDGIYTANKAGHAVITATGSYGLTASLTMKVLSGPTAITLPSDKVYMTVGEQMDLAPIYKPVSGIFTEASCTGYDSKIVSSEGTVVTALAEGTVDVTVETYNGLTASCEITVVGANEKTDCFVDGPVGILPHQKVDVSSLVKVGRNMYVNGYTISSASSSVTVSGNYITMNAETGYAELSISCSGSVMDTIRLVPVTDFVPEVYVDGSLWSKDEPITLTVSGIEGTAPQSRTIKINLTSPTIGENSICLGTVDAELNVDDTRVAVYTPSEADNQLTGTLAGGALGGTANLTIAVQGKEYSYSVAVTGRRYRALIIGEYNLPGNTSRNLPFSSVNTAAVEEVLSGSYDEIQCYSGNPTASSIQGYLRAMASTSADTDVTLIYLCTHGYKNSSNYSFGTPNISGNSEEKVSGANLTNELVKFKGQVILILDSCYSGVYLTSQKTAIQKAKNISVLTAQGALPASWYMNGSKVIEFFTGVLTKGLGSSRNASLMNSYVSASNADSNTDKIVTLNELFAYTKTNTAYICASYFRENLLTGCFYIGNVNTPYGLSAKQSWTEVPTYYIAPAANNLPILPID